MKKINYILIIISAFVLYGCDQTIPMEKDLYPQSVYLVGAKNKIIDRPLNIGYANDTVYASVAISGSRPINDDVTVGIEESPECVTEYNKKELGTNDILYRYLEKATYSFPQKEVVVKKGDVYATYPILINPASLHVDSLYMLAFKLDSTSMYQLAKEDTVVLMRLNTMNKYSGLYYMDGVIKPADNPNDSIIYKSPRNLQAVYDGKTVRMYHQKNEWSKGATDYRPGFCFTITINDDNSCTLKSWDKFKLISGGGKYYPDMKVYDLWYTFEEDGVIKKTRGFLYKERSNDDEIRKINDWMDENRKYDY